MTNEPTPPYRTSDDSDGGERAAEIEALLRRVPPDDEAQLAAFALLRAYRREALCAVAACVDPLSKALAISRAKERLKRQLLSLLETTD
ncbi:MAG: hypothetical protein H7Y15_01855 [Pseudonocardia sp.]|nr:hypothetical protein [Pseudonocardia sp.]